MDIPDDYFMAIADDLTDEEVQVKIEELRKLCNSVINPTSDTFQLKFGHCSGIKPL